MNRDKLKRTVESIEAAEQSIKDLSAHKREIYAGVKDEFDPKVLRKIIARRKLDPDSRTKDDDLLDQYEVALGMAGEMAKAAASGEVTYQEAADAADVSRRTMARHVARARAVPESTDDGASHDLKTREDTDAAPRGPSLPTAPQGAGVCTTRAQSVPDGGVGADTNSVEGGAPNSVRDGGAPVATSTVGPAVTTISSREAFAHLDELMAAEDDLAIPAHLKRERVA